MSFTAWAHGHARSILFLLGALALAGAAASVSLPVALFPQVSFPRVRITLDAGDRPAEQMTVEIEDVDRMVGQFLHYVRAGYRETPIEASADDVIRIRGKGKIASLIGLG